MFYVSLVLASALMWLAFELYRQAQETAIGDALTREQIRKSHDYLKAQLPRGCGVNVHKTVAVDYAAGIKNDWNWDEDLEKTQALPEGTNDANSHQSGMRAKVR